MLDVLKFFGIMATIIISVGAVMYYVLRNSFVRIVVVVIGVFSCLMIISGFVIGKFGYSYMLHSSIVAFPTLLGLVFYVKKNINSPFNSMLDIIVNHFSKGNIGVDFDNETINRNDEMGEISRALSKMTKKLNQTINEIRDYTETINVTAESQKHSSGRIAQDASEQAASVEAISSAMEEIVSNIDMNTENANQTDIYSGKTYEYMKEVEVGSNKSINACIDISNKISVINDIAFQTNILALNAAVEAARAGEHGKGFAVVASEIRNLAENSKMAADQIVNLVQETVDTTQNNGTMIGDSVPAIEKTSVLVKEIVASSSEQKEGTNQVYNSILQLNTVTQQNVATAEKMAQNSEELNNVAIELQKLLQFFQTA